MTACALLSNGGYPSQRFRLNADGTWSSIPPGMPLTKADIEHACCYWQLQVRSQEGGPFGFVSDPIAWCRSRVQAGVSSGRSVAESIWDGAWRWLFFEDLYAFGSSPSSVTVANTPLTQFGYGPNAQQATSNLLATGLTPSALGVLENVGAGVAPLLGRAFFAPFGQPLYLAGRVFSSAREAVMSLLPRSYWEGFVGFFDDLLGGLSAGASAVGGLLSGVAGTVADYGSAVLTNAAANPAATAQLLAQLGLIQQGTPQSAMGGMMVNPDTGSVMQAGVVPANLVEELKKYLPAILGGAATTGAIELGADALSGLAGFFGLGGGSCNTTSGVMVIPLEKCTKPPRRVVFQRPDGRQYEFTSRGRPLLYSGDVSAVKRVGRAANRARRSRPRRRALPAPSMNGMTRVVCGSCLTSPCGCK